MGGMNTPLMRFVTRITQTPPFSLVIQNDETECGLASLSMVLASHGLPNELELLRREYGSTRGGMTVGELCRFSSDRGLRAVPRTGPMDPSLNLPCVLFVRGEHFSVLWRISNGCYWIADPSDGALVLDQQGFDHYYSGMAISFRPIKRRIETQNLSMPLQGLSTILPVGRILTASVILLAIVVSVLTLVNAAAQDVFMTYIVEEGEVNWTKGLVIFTLVIGVSIAIAQLLMQFILMKQVQRSILTWNLDVFRSLFDAPYSFFINKTSGLIASRFNQVDASLLGFQSAVVASFTGLLNLTIFFVAVSLVSWPLALVALLAIAGFIAVGVKFYGLNIQNNYLAREGQAAAATAEYNLISGKDQIILEQSDASIIKQLTSGYLSLTSADFRIERTEAINEFFLSLVDQLLNATLLVLSAILIVQGHLTTGTYAAINVIIGTALQPIRSLSAIIESIQNSRITLRAANELYTPPPQYESAESVSESDENGGTLAAIRLAKVCFRHSAYAANIIDDLTITIRSRSGAPWCIHLDGSTGSGKTTFLNLLLGFAKPCSGEVLLFGHRVSDLPREERNQLVQLVDRSPTITTGSVFQNIHLGLSNSDETYLGVIRELGLNDQPIFSQQLQRFLQDDTSVSTGQAVMIALVRAALMQPRILLLDEALASLPETLHQPVLEGFHGLGINVLIVQHGDSAALAGLPRIDTRSFLPDGRTSR